MLKSTLQLINKMTIVLAFLLMLLAEGQVNKNANSQFLRIGTAQLYDRANAAEMYLTVAFTQTLPNVPRATVSLNNYQSQQNLLQGDQEHMFRILVIDTSESGLTIYHQATNYAQITLLGFSYLAVARYPELGLVPLINMHCQLRTQVVLSSGFRCTNCCYYPLAELWQVTSAPISQKIRTLQTHLTGASFKVLPLQKRKLSIHRNNFDYFQLSDGWLVKKTIKGDNQDFIMYTWQNILDNFNVTWIQVSGFSFQDTQQYEIKHKMNQTYSYNPLTRVNEPRSFYFQRLGYMGFNSLKPRIDFMNQYIQWGVNSYLFLITAQMDLLSIRLSRLQITRKCVFPFLFEHEQQCYQACPVGYIVSEYFNLCTLCPDYCPVCHNQGQAVVCDQCIEYHHRSLIQNNCTCDVGFTQNQLRDAECVACQSVINHCIQCTTSHAIYICIKCIEGYKYNQNARVCQFQLDCSLKQFAMVQHGALACICQSGYQWNSLFLQCFKDCSSAEHSPKVALSAQLCQCDDMFYWDISQQKCVVICGDDLKAVQPPNRLSSTECQCKQGFKYNFQSKVCWKDCSQIPYSIGVANSVTTCLCQLSYVWNSSQQKCKLNCSNKQYASNKINQTLCGCLSGYKWDQLALQCYLDCTGTRYGSGNAVSFTQCECPIDYVYVNQVKQCTYNCDLAENTTAFQLDSYCVCQSSLRWNIQNKKCWIDCKYKFKSTGFAVSKQQCGCIQQYKWSPIFKLCLLDCSEVKNSNLTAKSFDQCFCDQDFVFIAQYKLCVINCKRRANAVGNLEVTNQDRLNQNFSTTLSQYQCQCNQGYAWNSEARNCWLDCLNIKNSPKINSGQASCVCDQGFVWINRQNQSQLHLMVCLIDCKNKRFAQNVRASDTQCKCITSSNLFIWSQSKKDCYLKCDAVDHSTGVATTLDACICEQEYQWVPTSSQCKQTRSQSLSTGFIVAIALGSFGILLTLIVIFGFIASKILNNKGRKGEQNLVNQTGTSEIKFQQSNMIKASNEII